MLSEELSALRKERGFSQAQLAEKMNVSRQAVSRWETGEAAPSLDNLKCLSRLYKVSIDRLLGDGVETEREEPAAEAEVGEEEKAGMEENAGKARSHRFIPLMVALVVVVAAVTAIWLLWPSEAKEADRNAVIIGEDGRAIEGVSLKGRDFEYFASEPLDTDEEVTE